MLTATHPFRMLRDKKQKPARHDWRRYAETAHHPLATEEWREHNTHALRSQGEKTHHAQLASAAYPDRGMMTSFRDYVKKRRLIRHSIATFVLLPLALITAMSLCDQVAHASGSFNILFSIPVWYALMGAAVWCVLGFSGLFTSSLLYLYVLGHELTHALAVYCSLGSVHKLEASLDGGYIHTDKNNLFIALSPYFLPLWAMLWGVIWSITHIFWPTVMCEALLYSGLGFWWCFHLFWTAWVIPKGQPDLAENGVFFSLILVYFANLIVFLCLLRLFGAVSISQFWMDCISNAGKLWDTGRELLQLLTQLLF